MHSRKYKRKLSERRSIAGKRGNEAKRRIREDQAKPLEVIGTMTTSGVFGEHEIEVLSGSDDLYVWLRVDGELRKPRTLRGVQRITNKWIYRHVAKPNSNPAQTLRK